MAAKIRFTKNGKTYKPAKSVFDKALGGSCLVWDCYATGRYLGGLVIPETHTRTQIVTAFEKHLIGG